VSVLEMAPWPASKSSLYGDSRSVRESTALVVIVVSWAWRLWGRGWCIPVRKGELAEAWRSLEVRSCQNARKEAAILRDHQHWSAR
jgi:hypothetical protein